MALYPVLMQANWLQDFVCPPCDTAELQMCEVNFKNAGVTLQSVLAGKDLEIQRLQRLLGEKTVALEVVIGNEAAWLKEKTALQAQVAEAQGYTEALRSRVYSVCDGLKAMMKESLNDYEVGDEDFNPETKEAMDVLRVTSSQFI